jgi:hypothetical protein
MSRNILGKLTVIALAIAFMVVLFPAAAGSKPAVQGPSVTIPALPPDDPDADELGALPDAEELAGEAFPVWAYARFYTVWLPQYGLSVYHSRLAIWFVKDWDGESHTIEVVGSWQGETIDGGGLGSLFNRTWTYTDNAPWPTFLFGRELFKWTPQDLLKEASVTAYVYFDGVCVPGLCPYEKSVDYNRVVKTTPGSSND